MRGRVFVARVHSGARDLCHDPRCRVDQPNRFVVELPEDVRADSFSYPNCDCLTQVVNHEGVVRSALHRDRDPSTSPKSVEIDQMVRLP